MPKRYTPKQILKTLERFGFYPVSQVGSHMKLRNIEGIVVIVPVNQKVLAVGTFCSVLRQAKIAKAMFEKQV